MIRERLALCGIYAAVTAVMAGPFVNYSALASACYGGDSRLVIWILAWDNHALLSRVPLFDSNMFYPVRGSLAYSEHLFGISLFTLPIYFVTQNPVLAYNVVWLLAWMLNALAVHALLERYTGRHLPALAGSLVFTFSFYKMHHAHGHLQLVWTWLLPVSVLLLDRWTDKPAGRTATLWAIVVTLQSLASWYLFLMTVLVQAIAASVNLPTWLRTGHIRKAWHLALGAAAAAAVMWPLARQYRVLPATAESEVVRNSADLASYLVPPENTWLGQAWLAWLGAGPRWIWGEQTLYVGWLALALCAVGVVQLWIRQRYRVLALATALTVVAFVLSLGPAGFGRDWWSPFSLMSTIPGLGGFRAPARFALVVLLGLAILAAHGAALLEARGRAGRVALIGIMPLMLSEWYVIGFPAGKPSPAPVPSIYKTEEVRAARALVSLPIQGGAAWMFEADYLYYSTAHWRPIVNGYGRAAPSGYARAASHMMAFPGPNNARTMRELGVEYVVVHTERYPPGAGDAIVQSAETIGEYDLVRRAGPVYLFKVRPAPRVPPASGAAAVRHLLPVRGHDDRAAESRKMR